MKSLIISTIFTLYSFYSYGQQCIPEELVKLYDESDIIFLGKVVSREFVVEEDGGSNCWTQKIDKNCGSKTALFEIEEIFKGSLTERVSVYSIDGCYCLGTYFHKNQKYLVFANHSKNEKYPFIDKGACATEPATFANEQGTIKKLNAIKNAKIANQ